MSALIIAPGRDQMPEALGRRGLATTAMARARLRGSRDDEVLDEGASGSLISQTQSAIRRDIIRHLFAPGERLKIQSLVERYGVGLSPIREALALMSATGLVIREDRRGFRVAPMSLADYRDAQLVMGRLWSFALTLGLTNGDHDWEQRLVLALYRTLKFDWARAEREPRLYDEWDEAFRAFQRELVAGAGSPTLESMVDTLIDRLERYRWLVPEVKADTALDDRNHRALVDALVARDPERLRLAIRDYYAGGKAQRDAIEAKLGAS
jgi:GntR family carbon starvation induced transcriptional regulator